MNKHPTPEDDALLAHIRRELERQSQSLDAATADALQHARRRAVQTADKQFRYNHWRYTLSAGVAASLLLLVPGLLWLPGFHKTSTTQHAIFQDEAEMILLLEDEFEFYQNIEFYHWLAHEYDAG